LQQLLKSKGDIDVTSSELIDVLKKLHNSGVINVEVGAGDRIKITPNPANQIPTTGVVQTMYKYVKRPDVSGSDLLPTSRGFCVKLISNNRLYTRADIQKMSSIFGYDVFVHTGGWYYDPVKDEAVNHCRHQWQQVKVKKRN